MDFSHRNKRRYTDLKLEQMEKLFLETAFIRTSGTDEELRCANILMDVCRGWGLDPHLESFPVKMSDILEAHLYVDGEEVPSKGYKLSGNADLEAPLVYLPTLDEYSLTRVKDKIVLVDTGMGYWTYHDLLKAGAVGFITYDGNVNYPDCDIDQKELRPHVSEGNVIPGVNVNAKTARTIVEKDIQRARIVLSQKEYSGESHNVVLDLPGETDEWIILTAHYDSVPLSVGTYDNMTGSVGLLGIAEAFMTKPHRYGLRFVWCGSEERGLLGSKAYVADHEAEWNKFVLNINLDMIGSTMGRFIACCTTEEKLVHYIEYLSMEKGFPVAARTGVYSSDSTPFADKGIPALSFARLTSPATGTIHNRYDTIAILKMSRMQEDIDFIYAFTERMANAARLPVSREIPQEMKDKLDVYLSRKRDDHK